MDASAVSTGGSVFGGRLNGGDDICDIVAWFCRHDGPGQRCLVNAVCVTITRLLDERGRCLAIAINEFIPTIEGENNISYMHLESIGESEPLVASGDPLRTLTWQVDCGCKLEM